MRASGAVVPGQLRLWRHGTLAFLILAVYEAVGGSITLMWTLGRSDLELVATEWFLKSTKELVP